MTATATPPRPSTPPPPKAPPRPGGDVPKVSFGESSGVKAKAQSVVLYGPGGIGKSSLAAELNKAKVIDLDSGSHELDVRRVDLPSGMEWTWPILRQALQTPEIWAEVETVVIDTGTKAQELAEAYTVKTIKHEKGHFVDSVEGYGFGKGLAHVYDTFLPLLGDLDQHIRAGRNVVLICHDCTTNVPNPSGEDWLRYEPRLQSPASGKNSIRHRVREWCDHMLFVGYDVHVSEDGKGKGSGTRTIYPVELPHCMAKSRRLEASLPYPKNNSQLWTTLFNR